jgi:hypothetical protein
MPTPWAKFVTGEPEFYSYDASNDRLQMTASAGRRRTIICELDLHKGTLRQGTTPDNLQGVEAYRLNLRPWRGLVPPVALAHPFLLLHLLATDQADTQELLKQMASMGKNMTRTSITLRQPCPLLAMLHTRRVGLMLSTAYNLK